MKGESVNSLHLTDSRTAPRTADIQTTDNAAFFSKLRQGGNKAFRPISRNCQAVEKSKTSSQEAEMSPSLKILRTKLD